MTVVEQCYVLSNLVIKAQSTLEHKVLWYFRWKNVQNQQKFFRVVLTVLEPEFLGLTIRKHMCLRTSSINAKCSILYRQEIRNSMVNN